MTHMGQTFICGIDGCRGGWVAAQRLLDADAVSVRRVDSLSDLLRAMPVRAVAAVDIPIGLTDSGPRTCDLEARKLLGPKRGSSVFPAPIRPLLAATSYEEACQLRLDVDGRKISKQTYAIIPKIREMDSLLRRNPSLIASVFEIHPEVSFFVLAGGRPMQYSKKKRQGFQERLALLTPRFGSWVAAALSERKRLGCTDDDIVDAFVALWTAERIARGDAQLIPPVHAMDRYGLRMMMAA